MRQPDMEDRVLEDRSSVPRGQVARSPDKFTKVRQQGSGGAGHLAN